jgi:hypothetical protein
MRKKFFVFAMVGFLLSTIFVISCSENFGTTEDQISQIKGNPLSKPSMNFNISQFRMDEINQKALSLDFKVIHDKYSFMICDSVNSWRNKRELNSEKVNNVYDFIILEMSKDLNASKEEVMYILGSINYTKTNFKDMYNFHLTHPLPNEYRVLVDDLNQTYLDNYEKSDKEIIQLFEEKKMYYQKHLNPQIVFEVTEIAKSSYIHWKYNIDCVIGTNIIERANHKAGAQLAFGDGFGAAWGALGGPAGALLGAVGGTLGTAISFAIWGTPGE